MYVVCTLLNKTFDLNPKKSFIAEYRNKFLIFHLQYSDKNQRKFHLNIISQEIRPDQILDGY